MVLRITDAACEFRYGYVPQWESGAAATGSVLRRARSPDRPTGFGFSIVSAQYRQPALTDEPVEGRLHCRSNAHIDVVDARTVAEAGDDIDRLKDCVTMAWLRIRHEGGLRRTPPASFAAMVTVGRRHQAPVDVSFRD